MFTNIDARGMACPGPVIATKKALEGIVSGIVTILVDNVIAKENVIKFATAHGCGVSITQQEGDFLLKITKGEAMDKQTVMDQPIAANNTVYIITQDTLGHGNRELGAVLMKGFIYTLLEVKPVPKALLFMNSGVLLTIEDSPVLPHLDKLVQDGVEILSCGTCLDYFEAKDKLAVGGVTNMYTIVETMSASAKVITL
ncbi:MAG: selenium metabolism protein YedF [Firmicutes bacterium]|nr:selenium metabolism protein YedF [Bacillota bacterium]